MYRVISCLTGQHDYRLVALAAFVCVIASVTTFLLLSSMQRRAETQNWLLPLAGVCAAAGIWGTHFVAMLAYDGGVPVGYNFPLTAASLAVAFVATTLGLKIILKGGLENAALGGATIGLGICSMHFLGMRAIVVAGTMTWDQDLVLLSLIAGIGLSVAAALTHGVLGGLWAKVLPPLILVMAICSMHFTAMGAASIALDPAVDVDKSQIDAQSLGLLIGAVVIFLMMAGVCATMVGRLTIARAMTGFATAVTVTLAGTLGIGYYAMEQIRVGGPQYDKIAAGKDLIADILPPPAYVVEAYLITRIAMDEPDRAMIHRARFASLQRKYNERHEFWLQSQLIPDNIRDQLLVKSHGIVQDFWREADNNLFPALSRLDMDAAQASLDRLSAKYFSHRLLITKIVADAEQFSGAVEQEAGAQNEIVNKLILGAVFMLLTTLGFALTALRSMVVKPVLATAAHLENMTKGDLSAELTFARRSDEVGTMAKAIEQLRQASIDKLRLEKEAVEARRQRERERAAEAMHLRMANESITELNADLNHSIVQLKDAQSEIVRKGKLAQLGQLTATVAHEIRNPLGAVKTAAYLIERKTKDKNLGMEAQMQRINNGIQRCDKIITELLDFTRTKAIEATAQSVDGWVAAMVEEERRSIPAEVAIVTNYGTGEQPALFDAARMRRVMVNLLSNASEAMVGKAGDVNVTAVANPVITVTTRVAGGNVEIVVADNGPGISPENIAKIREPLFTTKSFGVGLGIPAIENILEQHGGGLRIESTMGEGARMTAWFPLKREALAAGAEKRVA